MSEAPENAVRSTEIADWQPPKLPVVDYDFKLRDKESVTVTVWGTLGDTVELVKTGPFAGWLFNFPRLKRTQAIYLKDTMGLQTWETERLYLDDETKAKLLERAKAASKKTNGKDGQ